MVARTGDELFDFCPWLFWRQATEEERARQLAWQERLRGRGVEHVGDRSYLSPLAAIYEARLAVGSDSYVAAHVYLTGDVAMGDCTTLNPYAVVRGTVRLGDGVRVGAYASVLGFNHSIDPAEPVYRQPVTSKGITVGDDVWIGSNAILLDGVTVGEHSVIGAGAVVTRDVPPWSVMAGNPARRVRDRRDPRPRRDETTQPPRRDETAQWSRRGEGDKLGRFAGEAREQARALLARCWTSEGFVDLPGAAATVRATCDAVEIADLLLGGPPPQAPAAAFVERLAARQDPVSGLIPEYGESTATWDAGSVYHILSVGYALDLLGSAFRNPIRVDGVPLASTLDSLPWTERAWHAGAWVDAYATALYWNRRWFPEETGAELELLFGWLLTRQDPWSGLWGAPTRAEARRQPVNGYYRLTRGSFAQFGVPVPRPETTIDTVLAHARDGQWFADGRGTACDVLDVIHPLWLCGQQTAYRRDEVRAWAGERLDAALRQWRTGAGFAFDPAPGADRADGEPSLRGTEMWLSIVWLLADVRGESGALGYRPRGVHRPEPGWPHPPVIEASPKSL